MVEYACMIEHDWQYSPGFPETVIKDTPHGVVNVFYNGTCVVENGREEYHSSLREVPGITEEEINKVIGLFEKAHDGSPAIVLRYSYKEARNHSS